MQHQHVRESPSARQLPRTPQPPKGVDVAQESPRLVQHEVTELVAPCDQLLGRGHGAQDRH